MIRNRIQTKWLSGYSAFIRSFEWQLFENYIRQLFHFDCSQNSIPDHVWPTRPFRLYYGWFSSASTMDFWMLGQCVCVCVCQLSHHDFVKSLSFKLIRTLRDFLIYLPSFRWLLAKVCVFVYFFRTLTRIWPISEMKTVRVNEWVR